MTPFFIPDTSPTFSYSPCVNCAESGGGGWQSAYSPRGDGYDQTFHQAQGQSGSSRGTEREIAFNITATDIKLEYAFSSADTSCPVEISLNGSSFQDGCGEVLNHLPLDLHGIGVRVKDEVDIFQFQGASGSSATKGGTKLVNYTLDDTSSAFAYSPGSGSGGGGGGGWQHVNGKVKQMGVGDLGDMGNYYNQSTSMSTKEGDQVDLTFKGTGIYLYGVSAPDGGTAEIRLDGVTQNVLNTTNPWRAYSSLMFMTTALSLDQPHVLSVINTSPGKRIMIDYALLTAPQASAGASIGALVGGIIGGSLAVLSLCLAIYSYISSRSRRWTTGYTDESAASTPASWKQKYHQHVQSPAQVYAQEFRTPSSAVPRHGDSGHWPIGKLYAKGGGASGPGPKQISPLPDYPDFVPYRLPASPYADSPRRSAYTRALPLSSPSPSAPDIIGLGPTADRWVRMNTSSGSLQSGTSIRGRDQEEQEVAVPPLPLPLPPSGRGGPKSNVARIPNRASVVSTRSQALSNDLEMDGTTLRGGAGEEVFSPSTPNFEIITHHAIARRSVARLWPTRDAVPSLLRSNSAATTKRDTSPTTTLPYIIPGSSLNMDMDIELMPSVTTPSPRTPGIAPGSGPTRGPQPHDGGSGTVDPPLRFPPSTYHYTSPRTPPSPPPPPGQNHRHSRNPSGQSQTVRRGVSIKSVKTIRSFFSGLMRSDSQKSIIPAVPRGYSAYQPAARPDSGIFPSPKQATPTATPETGSSNFFIELNADSPLSRPGSDWPRRPADGRIQILG